MTLEDYIRMKEIESHINNIMCETFKSLSESYSQTKDVDNKIGRMIFPTYGGDNNNEEVRVSEQELRFTFVEKFIEYCDKNKLEYFYSVETPTNDKYFFSEGKTVQELRKRNELIDVPCVHEAGISGNIDLVIHDENKHRICLIEFKANTPDEEDIEKDLVKLTNHKEYDKDDKKPIPRYFIGMVKSTQPTVTKNSIKEKLDKIKEKSKEERNKEKVHILFFNLIKEDILYEEIFEFRNQSNEKATSPNTLNEWLKNIQ